MGNHKGQFPSDGRRFYRKESLGHLEGQKLYLLKIYSTPWHCHSCGGNHTVVDVCFKGDANNIDFNGTHGTKGECPINKKKISFITGLIIYDSCWI